jgi:integrase
MPAIGVSIPIDEGVSVFNYQSGKTGWYVRRWEKHERKYRIKKIDGAETQEQALATFYKALATFETTKPRVIKKRSDAASFFELVDDFLEFEERRVMAGYKDAGSHKRRKVSMRVLLDYLAYKDVKYPSQVTPLLFEEYPIYRSDVMKSTIKSELRDIGVFFRQYLVPREHVSNVMVLSKTFFPSIVITDDELDANPAINPDDYRIINSFIRNEWMQSHQTHRGYYSRHYMWTFVHLLKNSGMRPKELLNVRYRDITLTNPKRWSESKQEWEDAIKLTIHVAKSKTGKKRDVLCSSNAGERLKAFLTFQRQYLAEHFKGVEITPDSLIFGKPDEHLLKGYAYTHLQQMWREKIYRPLKQQLKGNRFSEREYTLYSLRTTYIEDRIEEGMDIYLIARLAGNSVQVIQKYYDRFDVLKRAEEVQAIDYGKRKKPEVETINPLDL